MSLLARLQTTPPPPPPAPKPKGRLTLAQRVAEPGPRVGMEDYHEASEIKRIVALPVLPRLSKEEADAYSRENVLARAFDEGFRLFTPQAEVGMAVEEHQGCLGRIGVGWGKFLGSVLAASKFLTVHGLRRGILTVPPELVHQHMTVDLRWVRSRIPVPVEVRSLHARGPASRRAIVNRREPGLYLFPYSLLSAKDADELIRLIEPDYWIFDEAHRASNRSAARTRRVMKYLGKRREGGKPVRVVAMSGTITKKSILDYWAFLRHATDRNCPLPLTSSLVHEWASVLDAGAVDIHSTGDQSKVHPAIAPIVEWARRRFPDVEIKTSVSGFRRAFDLRLETAPGVVSTPDSELGVSLTLQNRPVEDHENKPGWEQLDELMRRVEDAWMTPDGDNIDHAIHKWKWLFELTAGFYNRLQWPTPEEFAERKKIGEAEAQEILARAKLHHAAGQEYSSLLRRYFEHPKEGFDTPFLVGQEFHQHGNDRIRDADLFEAWTTWKRLDFEGRPDRDSSAVRVCSFKVDAATAWALDEGKSGGLVWYYHKEIGEWLVEAMKAAGVDVVHCPSGSAGNKTIAEPENAKRVCVASWTAHGTGKNLQHHQNQIVVQWPRSANQAEQMLGRCHRNGQTADELFVRTLNTTEFDDINFAACLNDSLYIDQTGGSRQKLMYCGFDPSPRIYPPAVLEARGADLKGKGSWIFDRLKDKFSEGQ